MMPVPPFMEEQRVGRARLPILNVLILSASVALFCGCNWLAGKKPPPPMDYGVETPYDGVKTLAVAPAINLSGSHDFDPLVVSDCLFSEMQQVHGLNVLPLNKTLMAMRRLGLHSIDDVSAAQHLAEAMGADGIVIAAVTAYDPYKPPMVGMVLQMYTPPGAPVKTEPARAMGAERNMEGMGDSERQPVSQVSAVFNATNQTVLKELQGFAAGRSDYDSGLQGDRYLYDSDAYMRFVCHAMIRRLLDVERDRVSDR